MHFGRASQILSDQGDTSRGGESATTASVDEDPSVRRRPVTGVLLVVRWVRDEHSRLQVRFDLQVERSGVMRFDLTDSGITRITIGRESRVVGIPTRADRHTRRPG